MEPTQQFPPATDEPHTRASTAVTRLPERAVVAVGVALLASAVVLSTLYSRARGDIDWSNYTMGLLATVALLGVAVVAGVLLRDRDDRSDLVSWPGAFGAVASGLMVGVAMKGSDTAPYVVGAATVVVSVLGYLLARRAPFVVTAILGLAVLYAKLLDDVFDIGHGNDSALQISAAILAFTLVVTGLGWVLSSRVVSGVAVGALAVVGNAVLLTALALTSLLRRAFSGFDPSGGSRRLPTYDNDVWFVLGFAAVLVLLWAVCSALTGYVGFRLLIVAICVTVVPLAALVLATRHPTWWEVAVTGAGGLLLVGGALLTLLRRRRTGTTRGGHAAA